MLKSVIALGSVGLALFFFAGCDTSPESNYDIVGLVDASGTVTLDGQPLPNAVVTFENEQGQFSYGMTDSDGDYSLQFDSEADGVPPGPKLVRISTTRKILGLNGEEGEEGGESSDESGQKPAAPAGELVPEQYNKKSDLKVVVEPGGSQEFNFDLKSK